MNSRLRLVILFVLALLLFAALAFLPRLIGAVSGDVGFAHSTWKTQFVIKTGMILVALAGIAIIGCGFRGAGFRRATEKGWAWRSILLGASVGGAITLLIQFTPAQGMTFLRQLGLGGLVLWIWFYSSLAEEIFVRGWFQTALAPGGTKTVTIFGKSVTSSVLASGLLFGTLHLSLIFRGVDWWTVAIVFLGTTLLGLLAAHLRERYESLLPAIFAHVAFNVGGTFVGIIVVILTRVITGHLPAHG